MLTRRALRSSFFPTLSRRHSTPTTPSLPSIKRRATSNLFPTDKIPPMPTKVKTADRVARLRALMRWKDHDVQAYVIPSEDAHQSEYIAPCDARRAYISGFTGSAGCAVVTTDQAALFTDGRYFLQAGQQLDETWTLMKSGLPDVPTWQQWVSKMIPKGGKVGLDSSLISAADANALAETLQSNGQSLHAIEKNLVDEIWTDRPSRPMNAVSVLPFKYTGISHLQKISDLRDELRKQGAKGFVVSMLDEIAWLFNLRGCDIQYNPVFFAYALVTLDDTALYVDSSKISQEVLDHLGSTIRIEPYNTITEQLNKFSKVLEKEKAKLLCGSRGSWALQMAVGKENTIDARSPILSAKAIKNDTELEGIRQAHRRDAAALISYFAWLEDELAKGNNDISEVDGADRLEQFRAQKSDFVGLSFDTISSVGPNGAIIHYKPERESCKMIVKDKVYLCDSGGQYRDGTTDVTRTLHFGNPTAFEREAFTRVLQGHIALDSAIFPKGTTGYNLDILARVALWKAGLDYRHGTGHGVGAFLNVHEGPHGVGTKIAYNDVPLAEGMTVTNEPGYYDDGNFGMRIENVLLIRKAETPNNFGGRGYLGFEHVTLVPIGQRRMIDVELLTTQERDWINAYHRECLEKVGSLLKMGSLAMEWLKRETQPI